MARIVGWLLAAGLVFQLSVLPAHAYWKDRVAINEKNAAEYIARLKAGADPDYVKRPAMRFGKEYQAKKEQKRFQQAMDEAEELSRAGRAREIKELELQYQHRQKTESRLGSGC